MFQDEGCAPGGQPVGTAGDILPAARGAAPQQEDQHQHHHGLRAAEPRGHAQVVRGEALSGAEAGRGSHAPALHQAGECVHNFDIAVHCKCGEGFSRFIYIDVRIVTHLVRSGGCGGRLAAGGGGAPGTAPRWAPGAR